MAENEKPVADLKNPPSLIKTVDPNEDVHATDGYVGVSPEYTTAADHKFAPGGEGATETETEVEDTEPTGTEPTGTEQPKAPTEDTSKTASKTSTTKK